MYTNNSINLVNFPIDDIGPVKLLLFKYLMKN